MLTLASFALSAALWVGDDPAAVLRARVLLEEAVDLPTPTARARRARELARTTGAGLEDWLAAARGFAPTPDRTPGLRRVTVALNVEGAIEETELHVFVPASLGEGPAPLLMLFHGTGGSGAWEHAPWVRLAEELGMLLCAPTEAGPNEGYAFSPRERAAALAALRWMRRAFDVDETRIHASGVSRGAHLLWDVAARHPDRFASIAPLLGAPRLSPGSEQDNVRYLGNLTQVSIRGMQGAKDDAALVRSVRETFERLASLGAPDAERIEFPELAHSVDLEAVDWAAFFGRVRRDPLPDHVTRLSADPAEGRAAWAEILTLDRRAVHETFRPEVERSVWDALDEDARRRHLAAMTLEQTALLEVSRRGPGEFAARGRGVKGFRLLLPAEFLPAEGPVRVEWNGKLHTQRVRPERAVLLLEFVERFDRTFLPLVAVEID